MLYSGARRTRAVVMLAVLLAHFLFLLLFDLSMRTIRMIDRMPITFLTFINKPVERSHPDLKMDGGFEHARRAITVPDVTLNLSPETNSTSSVSHTIDWRAEASAAANQAAKKFTSRHFRSFDKQDPCSESDPLNNLKKECQIQTSRIDWNSELSPKRFGFGGHPHADGTLFEHLKPEYLKKPVEDVCTKNKVGCNHSSSSSAR